MAIVCRDKLCLSANIASAQPNVHTATSPARAWFFSGDILIAGRMTFVGKRTAAGGWSASARNLRDTMAYAKTDWSRFSKLPAFEAANRVNAYGQYLVMERGLLKR